MPIYDYFCDVCQKNYEVLHKISEPLALCEVHNIPMKKQITKISVRKGGGLYSIDSPSTEKMEAIKGFDEK